MSPRRGARLGGAGSRRAIIIVASVVVLLILVDVALVAVALGRTSSADNGKPGPIPTYSSTSTPTASASPSSDASASASASAPTDGSTASTANASEVTSDPRHLSVVSATEAWRADTGSCTGADAVLEHSTDGGATWTAVDLQAKFAAHRIDALRAGTSSVDVLAETGTDCDPAGLSSYTSGRFWAKSTTSIAGASVDSTGALLLSSGTAEAPCANPGQVVQGATATAVVCPDALAWRAGSGQWVTVPLRGLQAVAISGSSYTLARTGRSSCDGVQISRLAAAGITSGSKPTVVGCAETADADGPVGLGQTSSNVWVWAGDETLVSTDGGASW